MQTGNACISGLKYRLVSKTRQIQVIFGKLSALIQQLNFPWHFFPSALLRHSKGGPKILRAKLLKHDKQNEA